MDQIQEVLGIIKEIVEKSADGDYIFRGEPQCYPKVSSGLFREYAKDIGDIEDVEVCPPLGPTSIDNELARQRKEAPKGYQGQDYWRQESRGFNFNIPQDKICSNAKGYSHADLPHLQHFGAKTNLIDCSEKINVAIFFACNDFHDKPGRVILLKKEIPDRRIFWELDEEEGIGYKIRPGEGAGHRRGWLTFYWKESVWKPMQPKSRIDIQGSIFVQSPRGFVEPDAEVVIPAHLKEPMLLYLSKYHDMSEKDVYGDVHGFIKNYEAQSPRDSYKELALGRKAQDSGNNEKAIVHYGRAIDYFPDDEVSNFDLGLIYYFRARAYAAISDWDSALRDVRDFVMYSFYSSNELFSRHHPTDRSPYDILIDRNYNHFYGLWPDIIRFVEEVCRKGNQEISPLVLHPPTPFGKEVPHNGNTDGIEYGLLIDSPQ